MARPVLIDAYCGAGGASMGYSRAGFDVVGIDIEAQPRYPFDFVQEDLTKFDLVKFAHSRRAVVLAGSPPCKVHSKLKPLAADHHTDLIPGFRKQCVESGLLYVIENVPGASLLDPIQLCGSSFPGLWVKRHRLFESNLRLEGLLCDHESQAGKSPGFRVLRRYVDGEPVYYDSSIVGVYGRGQRGGKGEIDTWRKAMGIEWMYVYELSQAIPPAYTEYLGRQIMEVLD